MIYPDRRPITYADGWRFGIGLTIAAVTLLTVPAMIVWIAWTLGVRP